MNNRVLKRKHSMTRLKFAIFAALAVIHFVMPVPASALDITSQKTERHVLVPGTNAYFAAAPGLVLASDFTGFESKNRRIEVIVAYLDGPIESIEGGFSEASFTSFGMELLGKGELTIDTRRAVLYKILHDDGNIKWGKWVMLAEDGPGTLVVNAAFVSGDTDASMELEQMLKGVYMEPVITAAKEPAPSQISSDDAAGRVAAGDVPSPGSADVSSKPQRGDGEVSFDRQEAIAILAKEVGMSQNTGEDTTERDTSADKPERRGAVRIITEDGVVLIGDAATNEAGTGAGDDAARDSEAAE